MGVSKQNDPHTNATAMFWKDAYKLVPWLFFYKQTAVNLLILSDIGSFYIGFLYTHKQEKYKWPKSI